MCWIAYLTREDSGKRVAFETRKQQHFFSESCTRDTEITLTMYNGEFVGVLRGVRWVCLALCQKIDARAWCERVGCGTKKTWGPNPVDLPVD